MNNILSRSQVFFIKLLLVVSLGLPVLLYEVLKKRVQFSLDTWHDMKMAVIVLSIIAVIFLVYFVRLLKRRQKKIFLFLVSAPLIIYALGSGFMGYSEIQHVDKMYAVAFKNVADSSSDMQAKVKAWCLINHDLEHCENLPLKAPDLRRLHEKIIYQHILTWLLASIMPVIFWSILTPIIDYLHKKQKPFLLSLAYEKKLFSEKMNRIVVAVLLLPCMLLFAYHTHFQAGMLDIFVLDHVLMIFPFIWLLSARLWLSIELALIYILTPFKYFPVMLGLHIFEISNMWIFLFWYLIAILYILCARRLHYRHIVITVVALFLLNSHQWYAVSLPDFVKATESNYWNTLALTNIDNIAQASHLTENQQKIIDRELEDFDSKKATLVLFENYGEDKLNSLYDWLSFTMWKDNQGNKHSETGFAMQAFDFIFTGYGIILLLFASWFVLFTQAWQKLNVKHRITEK